MSDISQNITGHKNLTIYKASAGSGKTFQLTKDYIYLLFSGLGNEKFPHRRILAVTFTNKATSEMKSRILQELDALSKGAKSDYREALMVDFSQSEDQINQTAKAILIQILHDYSAFSISTIDSFFQQVIRTFAHEIGVNSGYGLELEEENTLQQAVDNMFLSLSDEGNEQLLEWLTELAEENIETDKSWNQNKNIVTLGKELLKEDFRISATKVYEKLQNKGFLMSYKDELNTLKINFEDKINALIVDFNAFISERGIQAEDFYRKNLQQTFNKFYKKDYTPSDTFRNYAEDIENCYTKAARSNVKSAFQNCYHSGLQSRLLAILYAVDEEIIFYNSANQILKNLNLLGVFSDLTHQIKILTDEQNIMLISDTNQFLNQIIDDSDAPFIYERVGTKIDHFMIDEFQDTSVLQWKNFNPLIINSLSSSNFNMVVGDIKQSIYRFRNSDWKLLSEQISKDLSKYPIKSETLSTNWRSDKNIITFNNSFFTLSATLIQKMLNEEFRESKINNDYYANLCSKITDAYSDVKQNFSNKANEGYVRIEFIPEVEKEEGDEKGSEKEKFEDNCLKKIPKLLEDLVDRGFKPSDVAFLVKKRKEATKITNYLLNYKKTDEARPDITYNLVGNEGLPLSQSTSIGFIIAVLSFLLNPKDEVNCATMNFEYFTLKNKSVINPFQKPTTSSDNDNWDKAHFTAEEKMQLKAIKNQSLLEVTEKIIQIFNINEKKEDIIYLQAFQDTVFAFMNNQHTDLSGFLEWWKQNESKQIVNVPENEQSFKIMTIHKAKGLDFKVVIVPFLNWAMDSSKNNPTLWFHTDVEPFNKLPVLPVQYASNIINTIFRDKYLEEKLYQYVDNLNVTYVAFTRARNEMYCFAPLPKASKEKTPTIAKITYEVIQNENELSPNLEETPIFELGEPTNAKYPKVETESTIRQTNDYPSVDSSSRLFIKQSGKNIWDETSTLDNKINLGVIMHEILQNIMHKSDVEKAIYNQVISGKINNEDAENIKQQFVEFWEQEGVEKWFATDIKILNEATILLPSGKKYRPDRIVFTASKVIVIDYKFGEEHKKHSSQLKRYVDYLKEMGYENIESYLYYVSLKKIVKGEL